MDKLWFMCVEGGYTHCVSWIHHVALSVIGLCIGWGMQGLEGFHRFPLDVSLVCCLYLMYHYGGMLGRSGRVLVVSLAGGLLVYTWESNVY